MCFSFSLVVIRFSCDSVLYRFPSPTQACDSFFLLLSITPNRGSFPSCIDHDVCEFGTDFSQRKEEARVAKERKELAWQRDHAYDDIMTEDNLAESSNQDRDEDFLDDFM
jgi:hypothetical protein